MKILITYAYAGVGHKKAGEAVYKALADAQGNEVKIVDVLDYTNSLFKLTYPSFYLFLINRVPLFWGFLYYFFDNSLVDKISSPIRGFIHRINAKAFIKFILDTKPDVVVSTHFLPSEVIAYLKKKGLFKGKLITIITDFLPHNFWLAQNSDFFIVCLDKTKENLIRRGVAQEKIKVLGIPCDPIFGVSKDRSEIMAKLKLKQGFFNVLMMGGGFGTGPLRETIESLYRIDAIKDKIQVIAICGKNESLYKELESVRSRSGLNLAVFGYMDNVDEFMSASDCIVTKSGGLTITEALSKKLPMIIIKPIMGQETRNCRVLTDFEVARRANSAREVVGSIRDLIMHPDKVLLMRSKMSSISYPEAAKKIKDFILTL